MKKSTFNTNFRGDFETPIQITIDLGCENKAISCRHFLWGISKTGNTQIMQVVAKKFDPWFASQLSYVSFFQCARMIQNDHPIDSNKALNIIRIIWVEKNKYPKTNKLYMYK